MLENAIRPYLARLAAMTSTIGEKIPPGVWVFLARVRQVARQIVDISPLAGMLLLALTAGTLGAVVSNVLFRNHAPTDSAYDVVRAFFHQREEYDFTYQEKLVDLTLAEADPELDLITSPPFQVTGSMLRIKVDYPAAEDGPAYPLELTFNANSDGQEESEVFSAAFTPSARPSVLEILLEGPDLQVHVERPPSSAGSDWPEATIAIGVSVHE